MKITQIKQQVKRPDRYSIYVDNKFAFGLSEAGLLSSGLASGQEISKEQFDTLKSDAATDKAYGNALRYVAMRPRSVWELQQYFMRKKVDEPVAKEIIDRLRAVDLLDDRKFAEAWVMNRRLLKPTSRRKLQLELRQKHVAGSIIDAVLAAEAEVATEAPDRTALAEIIAKKQARYPDQIKFMQYLARQGFGYDDIKRALQNPEES
ncbi:MAG TPA: RecX family transcriptional regulator [Candidatus Saccharimonadales bacterium]|nr:RecX family transcriptional regulator [Candidatus Saccharimonadales bacterium]